MSTCAAVRTHLRRLETDRNRIFPPPSFPPASCWPASSLTHTVISHCWKWLSRLYLSGLHTWADSPVFPSDTFYHSFSSPDLRKEARDERLDNGVKRPRKDGKKVPRRTKERVRLFPFVSLPTSESSACVFLRVFLNTPLRPLNKPTSMPRAFLVKKANVSPGKRNWSELPDHERGDVYIPGESTAAVMSHVCNCCCCCCCESSGVCLFS